MGIAEDLYQLKSLWSKFSVPMKLLSIVSMLSSFLSIASLSDQIYRLKGFIYEAVVFWHFVTARVLVFFEWLELHFEQWQLDYWAILFLVMVPIITGRWSYVDNYTKFRYLLAFVLNLTVPFYFGLMTSLAGVVFAYLFCLVVIFWPPVSGSYMSIGVRILLPPVLFAILAAISIGISKPLT